jgi:3-isopropylmalate dehydrogenase
MKIALLPGDGIGPEIVAETVKVLNGLGERFEFEEAPIGGAGYEASGRPLPEATLALAQQADAVLVGATGVWKYDTLERALRPEQGILELRKELKLYANLRPAYLYEELVGSSPMKPEKVRGLDILIVRELNGDIYFGQPRGTRNAPDGEFAGAREGASTPCATPSRRLPGSHMSHLRPRKNEGRKSAMLTRQTCWRPRSFGARR